MQNSSHIHRVVVVSHLSPGYSGRLIGSRLFANTLQPIALPYVGFEFHAGYCGSISCETTWFRLSITR